MMDDSLDTVDTSTTTTPIGREEYVKNTGPWPKRGVLVRTTSFRKSFRNSMTRLGGHGKNNENANESKESLKYETGDEYNDRDGMLDDSLDNISKNSTLPATFNKKDKKRNINKRHTSFNKSFKNSITRLVGHKKDSQELVDTEISNPGGSDEHNDGMLDDSFDTISNTSIVDATFNTKEEKVKKAAILPKNGIKRSTSFNKSFKNSITRLVGRKDSREMVDTEFSKSGRADENNDGMLNDSLDNISNNSTLPATFNKKDKKRSSIKRSTSFNKSFKNSITRLVGHRKDSKESVETEFSKPDRGDQYNAGMLDDSLDTLTTSTLPATFNKKDKKRNSIKRGTSFNKSFQNSISRVVGHKKNNENTKLSPENNATNAASQGVKEKTKKNYEVDIDSVIVNGMSENKLVEKDEGVIAIEKESKELKTSFSKSFRKSITRMVRKKKDSGIKNLPTESHEPNGGLKDVNGDRKNEVKNYEVVNQTEKVVEYENIETQEDISKLCTEEYLTFETVVENIDYTKDEIVNLEENEEERVYEERKISTLKSMADKNVEMKCGACQACSAKLYGPKQIGEYYCETCSVERLCKKCEQCGVVLPSLAIVISRHELLDENNGIFHPGVWKLAVLPLK